MHHCLSTELASSLVFSISISKTSSHQGFLLIFLSKEASRLGSYIVHLSSPQWLQQLPFRVFSTTPPPYTLIFQMHCPAQKSFIYSPELSGSAWSLAYPHCAHDLVSTSSGFITCSSFTKSLSLPALRLLDFQICVLWHSVWPSNMLMPFTRSSSSPILALPKVYHFYSVLQPIRPKARVLRLETTSGGYFSTSAPWKALQMHGKLE